MVTIVLLSTNDIAQTSSRRRSSCGYRPSRRCVRDTNHRMRDAPRLHPADAIRRARHQRSRPNTPAVASPTTTAPSIPTEPSGSYPPAPPFAAASVRGVARRERHAVALPPHLEHVQCELAPDGEPLSRQPATTVTRAVDRPHSPSVAWPSEKMLECFTSRRTSARAP